MDPAYCKTRRGGVWKCSNLRQVMIAARIAGCTEVATEWDADDDPTRFELVRNTNGALPAIITIEELLQLRELFRLSSLRSSGGGGKGRLAKHLLSGIALCPFCERGLYWNLPGPVSRPMYLCRHCALLPRSQRKGVVTAISGDFLDEFITGATLARIRSGAVATILNKAVLVEGASEIAAKINHEESQLHEFLELAEGDGDVSARAFHAFTTRSENRITTLKAQLSGALADRPEEWAALLPSDIAETVEARWEEADMAFKRRLIKLCFAKIIIHPAVKRGRAKPETMAARVELVPREAVLATAESSSRHSHSEQAAVAV